MAIYSTFGNSNPFENPFDFENCKFTRKQRLLNVYTLFQILHRLWMEESLSIGEHDHRGLKIKKGSNRQFFAVNRKLFLNTIFFLWASFLHKVCTCPSKKRNEILPKIFGQGGARKPGRRLKLRRGRNLFQDKSLHWAEITSSRSEIIQFFYERDHLEL